MRLIIGGAFQGKMEFACQLTGKAQIGRGEYADGARDPYEEAFARPVIYQFHEYLRRLLKEGGEGDIASFLSQIERRNPEALILMDEVGYGIVPMDPEERRFREEVGRAGQKLAGMADEVYRVVCGIGTRIR